MDYGFTLPDGLDETHYRDFKSKYQKTLDRRKSRWNMSSSSINFNLRSRKLKRFIRKGIPTDLREEAWMKCSGAETQMFSNPGLFDELFTKELDSEILRTISADISRTFPENVYYRKSQGDKSKTKSLERVLRAFASRNPFIGYCQGLNYVAAIILLIISSEEKAFWLFDTLITKIVQPYYNPGMECVQVDCFVLEELIRMKIPKLHQAINDMETSCIAMCTKWFVCLYVDVLPVETTIRIFDCLIYEGDKILFRVATSILKSNLTEFTSAQTFPDFAICFRKVVSNNLVINCHSFMENVFKQSNPLSYRLIRRLRKRNLIKLKNGSLRLSNAN